jgi:ribulose-phosphate 3-epimerase
MPVRISASLVSAPVANLAATLIELETAGVDLLHFDIEDGVFLPLIRLGTKLLTDLRPLTRLPFDVHLMTVDPEWMIPDLTASGANRIAVHMEACSYPRRVLRTIVAHGAQAGIALNPVTPLTDLTYLLPYLSFVVVLTTEPEKPDEPYLPGILAKVEQGKRLPGMRDLDWVVDGGINSQNVGDAIRAGASTVVMGRAVFGGGVDRIQDNLRALRQAASP